MNRIPSSSWRKIMVLAVHPDDESLSAAGLIQQALAHGGDVRVIFLTDGDNNPWPQRYVERRWRIGPLDRVRWGERRRGEAIAALTSLGVRRRNISFWRYPDQGLCSLLMSGRGELIARLIKELSQWQPTLLVAPSALDLHLDHNALAVLLKFAMQRRNFPHPPSFTLLDYLVHAREGRAADGDVKISLTPEQVARKQRAILCHATQMALSRRRFLAFAQPAETFFTDSEDLPSESQHPVLAADFLEDCLQIKLRHLVLPATLLLAAETPTDAIRLTVKLSFRSMARVLDAATGKLIAETRLVRGRSHSELLLPAVYFSNASTLFAKIAAGLGFYDRTGWRTLSLRPNFVAVACGQNSRYVEPRICAIIPCYNLAGICGPIVRAAADFADHVIAVNDGSTDDTERVLREVAGECRDKVQVLSFAHNCGKGVALLEAFRAAQTIPFDVLVTLDGDGQHQPEDIPRLAQSVIEGGHDLVVGERLARTKMPLRSRVGNTFTAHAMRFFYPAAPTDTQSGFRAFRRDFVREIVKTIEGGRYETELEILLLALQRGRRVGSVTIPTVYLDGNRHSHFRPLIDSWRIYRTLFRWQFNLVHHPEVRTSLNANR